MSRVVSVKKIGRSRQRCLTVSADDGLFVLGNGIVTHNSDEKIMTFMNKLRGRIMSRMKGNFYGRFIIDSSPNDMESPIDSYVFQDAPKSVENFVFTGSRWKFFHEEFTDFEKKLDDDYNFEENHDYSVAFALFKGGNGKPPAVIENPAVVEGYDPADIIWCPRRSVAKTGTTSYIDLARENPIEFMKDYAGVPAGAADRIFYDPDVVEDVFDNSLRNLYGYITADAEAEPEHLIWDQVYSTFFYKILDKTYFYYKPELPRVLTVDQSLTGDSTCIAMSHNERDPTKVDPATGDALTVVVVDFTVVIVPKGGTINLDAIKFFIYDLVKLGNLRIRKVSFDQFQSAPTIQFLKRVGINVEKISVDRSTAPYLAFIDLAMHRRFHCGKNVFVRNNMRSLHMTKRKGSGTAKVEHFVGDLSYDYVGDWERDKECKAGFWAKDATDALAGNVELLNIYSSEFLPYTTWDPGKVADRSYEAVKKANSDVLKKMGFR